MSKPLVIGSAEWLVVLRDGGFKGHNFVPTVAPSMPTTPWLPRGQRGPRPRVMMRVGQPCAYCKRPMSIKEPGLWPTRDHVVPLSKGGRETVWACFLCNQLKADMMPDDWEAFMASFPQWWDHPEFRGFGLPPSKERSAPKPVRPKSVPIEYPNDPKAQAAFEAVFRNRLHMLRVAP